MADGTESKKTRSKPGQGTFREKPSGTWEGSRWLSEVQKRVYVTALTEQQARKLLEKRVVEVHRGERTARKTTVTFQSYAEDVIRDREGINNRTRDLYSINLRLYLKHLHSYRLGDITASVLRATYAGLRKKGLSDTVRGHAHTLARLILETARIDGLIARNPADEPTIRPKSTRGDEAGVVRTYDAQQVAWILRAAPQVTHGELIAFLLLTGVRRGEALALRWSSVYQEQQWLTIRATRSLSNDGAYEGSPKTKQSRRNVPLSGEVLALLNHLKVTNRERREMLYPDLAESPYVFTGLTGKAMRPDNVRRIMHRVLDVADQEIVQVEKQRAAETGVKLQEFRGGSVQLGPVCFELRR